MCGIISYTGTKQAYPIILNILRRLEYRGYDSAGIALFSQGQVSIIKEQGPIEFLAKTLDEQKPLGSIGLGHTRWATHGQATSLNAHPHHCQDKTLSMVHNGTILNYYQLKEELLQKDYSFYGDTDSEVLVNYLHYLQTQNKSNDSNLTKVIAEAATKLEGRSAFVVFDVNDENKIYACNLGGELFIGRSQDQEFFVCSDKNALVDYAQEYFTLEANHLAILDQVGNCLLYSLANTDKKLSPSWQEMNLIVNVLDKGGYPHFMLKEIFEQDEVVTKTISQLTLDDGRKVIDNLDFYKDKIKKNAKLVIIACGTSWHAGLVARHFFSKLANLPVYCEYASEFIASSVGSDDIVIAISQSGSTADTLQAAKAAQESGATLISICNVDDSALTLMSDAYFLTLAGPEIGVASTKAFTTQLAVLFLLATQFGQWRDVLTKTEKDNLWQELQNITLKMKEALQNKNLIKDLAKKYQIASSFLYLGRGQNFPIAMEGALKLKEVSYIHAEGLSAGEMKHGSIALIDDMIPSLFIAIKDEQYEKVINNLLEIRARNGRVLAIATAGDKAIKNHVDDIIEIPECLPILSPFLTVLPLQLFAYYVALERGTNIDKPRNLAKSVTVE